EAPASVCTIPQRPRAPECPNWALLALWGQRGCTARTRALLGLEGPRYISPAPNGGFVVSEECGDVKVFTSSRKLLCSLSSKYGHRFGNPAGVCVDVDGSIMVADEQRRTVHLFPEHGAPICLVSAGLRRPAGVACSSLRHLFVLAPPSGTSLWQMQGRTVSKSLSTV
ncbi:PREDICTED: NHL-repeat-containing protein 4, partial [Chlamydotis macqueenii]|uniref:NHL-repeat-containing protein 4 n=1 Tax=Chlamydotis macqueenii TaxID=187382 RepID=UPI000529E93C